MSFYHQKIEMLSQDTCGVDQRIKSGCGPVPSCREINTIALEMKV